MTRILPIIVQNTSQYSKARKDFLSKMAFYIFQNAPINIVKSTLADCLREKSQVFTKESTWLGADNFGLAYKVFAIRLKEEKQSIGLVYRLLSTIEDWFHPQKKIEQVQISNDVPDINGMWISNRTPRRLYDSALDIIREHIAFHQYDDLNIILEQNPELQMSFLMQTSDDQASKKLFRVYLISWLKTVLPLLIIVGVSLWIFYIPIEAFVIKIGEADGWFMKVVYGILLCFWFLFLSFLVFFYRTITLRNSDSNFFLKDTSASKKEGAKKSESGTEL